MVVLALLFSAGVQASEPEAADVLKACLVPAAHRISRLEDQRSQLAGLLYRLAWWQRAPRQRVEPGAPNAGLAWKVEGEIWRDERSALAGRFECRPENEPMDPGAWMRWEGREIYLEGLARHPEATGLLRRLRAREAVVARGDEQAAKRNWSQALKWYRQASAGLPELPPALALRLAWSGTDSAIRLDDLAVRASTLAVGIDPLTRERLDQRVCRRVAELRSAAWLELWNELAQGSSADALWAMAFQPCPVLDRWVWTFSLLGQAQWRELAQENLRTLREELGQEGADRSWLALAGVRLRDVLRKDLRLAHWYRREVRTLRRREQIDRTRSSLSSPRRLPVLEVQPAPDFGPVPALPPLEAVSFVAEWRKLP